METELTRKAGALEAAFYVEHDDRVQESLREMRALAGTSGLLVEVSALSDPQILFRLAQLEVSPSVAAALAIFPLVAVAWADGTIDPNERRAIQAVLDEAFFFQTIDRDVIHYWLGTPPPPELHQAWESYAVELGTQLGADLRTTLGRLIVFQAKTVADAAGGFLGFGGVSPAEQAYLDHLSRVLA